MTWKVKQVIDLLERNGWKYVGTEENENHYCGY